MVELNEEYLGEEEIKFVWSFAEISHWLTPLNVIKTCINGLKHELRMKNHHQKNI